MERLFYHFRRQSQPESQHICHQNYGNFPAAAPNSPPPKIRMENTPKN
ncbi:MAG: hypothetical protein KIC97_05545 [Firmicutes bacterium]|nr:hypothetical protein [Bacillota bacterium]